MNALTLEPRDAGSATLADLSAVGFDSEPWSLDGAPQMCKTTCVSWVTWTCDTTTFCASPANS